VFRSTEHYSPEYFTNSFHVNVTEDITPFEKQDREFTDFHLCEGGHIQYVRLDNPENFEAVKAVIRRGMKKGFYQGVNFDSAYCGDCGRHSTNVLFKCPHCGSANLPRLRLPRLLQRQRHVPHERRQDGRNPQPQEHVRILR
jgi:anaerobic ribonucleoside-triphosphate reductase